MTREELAAILDMIGTREGRLSNRPFTMQNLDELIYQLRKEPGDSGAGPAITRGMSENGVG